MKDKILRMLPYLIINILSFYLLPLLMVDTGSSMFILLTVIPFILLATSVIYGIKSSKTDIVYSLLVGILFIPAIYIYMNSSALIYVPGYFLIALLFNFIGSVLNIKKVNK